MMNADSALHLLNGLLTDLRQVQVQLVRWLPILAARVNHPGLRHLVKKHTSESSAHLLRLDQFFTRHDTSPAEGTSKAIKLMIDDSNDYIPDIDDPDRSDLILMIQMLRIEQFEITSYEIVARIAEKLGFEEDTQMLLEFLAARDAAASILRDLQSNLLENAFPMETRASPVFAE